MAAAPGDVLTIDELAEYLKISKSTLYKLVQEGALPGQKIGRRWRFHKDAIDSWLKNRPLSAELRREEPNRER
ncbi:MAG TPA: helix-turn-helix domain-containing protein [Thermoguttaceae bacterium]|nr:helix-turn-helix domain-containing protein [Thermoguttaceae bacterium]